MTIQLSENYPKIIRDLFLYDRSTYSIGSYSSYQDLMASVLHMPVALPFEYDRLALLKEALTLPYTQKVNGVGKCVTVKKLDDDIDPAQDFMHDHDAFDPVVKFIDHCPHIKKFIDDANQIGTVTYLSFKTLAPGGYILPHIDSLTSTVIYVPLLWPKGNYFKVLDNGLIEFEDHQPKLINTHHAVHSVVNDSDTTRIIFSFNIDWQTEQAKKLVWDSYLELS